MIFVILSGFVLVNVLIVGHGLKHSTLIKTMMRVALVNAVFAFVAACVGVAMGQTVDAREVVQAMGRETHVPRFAVRIPPDIRRTEPAVLLARMAWREAGALVKEGEVAAFHDVITNRLRGSYQSTAWGYSTALRNPANASTHQLGRAPLSDGYPELFRTHWPRVLAAADAAVAGTLRHSCATDRRLEHWGGPPVDRASLRRLERAGYQRVECPGYANTFLARRAP